MKKEEYIEIIRKRLSEKRFHHSLCVSKEAVFLAKKYGGDIEICEIAGILHDICKEADNEELISLVSKSDLDVCEIEKNSRPLWHSIAGAVYVKENLGIDNNEILKSIRYHTVAHRGMSINEKIILMADFISEDRDYEEVDKLRDIAHSSLDDGLLYAMKYQINDIVKKENPIPFCTIDFYNELTEKNK